MKVIITEHFQKHEYKHLSKYFSLSDFTQKLKKLDLITLKMPYFKIKFYLGGVAFRGVIMQTTGGNLVPLMLALKKSKDGENIMWDLYKKQILERQEKALECIQEGLFEVY